MSTSIYSGMGHSRLALLGERSFGHTPLDRALAIGLGIVTLVCAILGSVCNVESIGFVSSQPQEFFDRTGELPHFGIAFYLMSSICFACYGASIWGAYRLLWGRKSPKTLLVSLWVFEVLYFLAVAASWLLPEVGRSIAAATGLANGGLTFQFAILLPLWGPLVALWLGRGRATRSSRAPIGG